MRGKRVGPQVLQLGADEGSVAGGKSPLCAAANGARPAHPDATWHANLKLTWKLHLDAEAALQGLQFRQALADSVSRRLPKGSG